MPDTIEDIAPRCASSALPSSLPPRGLSRLQAAEYIGVGVTKFDEMVADGRMPKPKRIDGPTRDAPRRTGRVIWDRVQLDEAFSLLDQDPEVETASGGNKWDKL
jgi:hypothetical protein